MILDVPSADDMRALGRRLAAQLGPGDLVLLTGPLGAGKTTLTQGLAAGLGAPGPVTSPTFVIARAYRGGRCPVVHVDAYRLSSVDEVDDLDLDATVAESVTVVEWGEGLVEGLAEGRLEVRIELAGVDADAPRRASVRGVGERWRDTEWIDTER